MSRRVHRTPEAAKYLGCADSTLEKWRITGKGPRFIRIGTRAIGYIEADLDAFIEAGRPAAASAAAIDPVTA